MCSVVVVSPNRGQPFEASDEDVGDDLKPIGLQDSPEMVTRHYFQLHSRNLGSDWKFGGTCPLLERCPAG